MPKVPHLSGREIIRALERMGFEAVRQSGSHVVMRATAEGAWFLSPSRSRLGHWLVC